MSTKGVLVSKTYPALAWSDVDSHAKLAVPSDVCFVGDSQVRKLVLQLTLFNELQRKRVNGLQNNATTKSRKRELPIGYASGFGVCDISSVYTRAVIRARDNA